MDVASLREMQNEELEVIQAIYMDDYVDHTEGSGPPLITLKLVPLQSIVGKDVHAKVDMRVQFTTQYPLDAPVIHLENEKGISREKMEKLKQELDKMACDLCGEVMVLQLAQHVQSYLHQFNVPNLSFFDQMLVNQQKQEEILTQEKEKEREAKVAEDREHDQDVIRQVKEELVKREEAIKEGKRKRHESLNLSQNSLSTSQNTIQHTVAFSCPLSSKERKFSVSIFKGRSEDRKLFCSTCVGHFFDGACCMMAIDELSGKVLSIAEWKPQIHKKRVNFDDTDSDVTKQIQSIEQEFSYIMKTNLHCNGLLNYHSLEIEHTSNSISAKVLMDLLPGDSLYTCWKQDGLSIVIIQSICKQIVDALSLLHNKSIVHKNLCLTNTFLCANNKVVLSGYTIIPRISKLCKLVNRTSECASSMDQYNEIKEQVKIGKKGDVFNLGLILLSLYQGHINIELPVVIEENVLQVFRDFLNCCLKEDETDRYSIQQLSKHPFLLEKLSDNVSLNHTSGNTQPTESDSSFFQYNESDVHLPIFPDHLVLGKSRLINEFEVIEWMGKGGFGSVIKVRNKLDGNTYAIKRISLKPKSLHLNKKITREVKLLSRLNHENVVRYFNSWIEAEDITLCGEMSSETDSALEERNYQQRKKPQHVEKDIGPKRTEEDSLLGVNNINFEDCPEVEESNEGSWCCLQSNRQKSLSSSSSTSSVENSYQNVSSVSTGLLRSQSTKLDSSEGIRFEIEDSMFGDKLDSDDSDDESDEKVEETDESSDSVLQTQYLYIQMECCEIKTLRIAIDDGLYKKPSIVWKHFREIVEGMAHVHTRGIIHRDLKPINIFMDSSGKIKIGDFGLATSHVTIKQSASTFPDTASSLSTDATASGNVGTALYIAPEICEVKSRMKVTPKVDMYSLGIILFEMFYKPLETKMERIKVLGLLRTTNIIFPEDFPIIKKVLQDCSKEVCKTLLDHNPDNRPSAQELLESGYIPPKMEDNQLDELLKHTLSQSNSTRYQRLMSALFNQTLSPVADQLYDKDDQGKNEASVLHIARLLQHVRNVVTKVFTQHDAVFIEVPLLMPKNKLLEDARNAAIYIDQSGLQLCLPYDSRVCFARYISKNSIFNVKRFYFGKLYREQSVMGAHPASLWECSYDIVSDSSTSLVIEAEMLYTVNEIIKEFPKLHERNFYVRLAHVNFAKAIFLQSKLDEETQTAILKILEASRNLKQIEEVLRGYLTQQSFPEHAINKLITLLTFEGSVSKAVETLQVLRKTKPNISNLTKQAFHDIELLSEHLTNLSCDFSIQICTYLVPKITHYNGIFFQVVAENERKQKRGGVDILAQGGCYCNLIKNMSKYAETSVLPSAVGVSIDIEKVLHSVMAASENETLLLSKCDVIVCIVMGKDLQILHTLWAAGITANPFSYELNQDFNLEEIQDYCKKNNIRHMVTLKETEKEFIRLRSFEKDSKKEERFDDVNKLCVSLLSRLKLPNRQEKEADAPTKTLPLVQSNSSISCEFKYVSSEKNDTKDTKEKEKRKRIESTFMLKYRKELHRYFGNNVLHVVVSSIDRQEIKSIAGFFEITGTDDEFEASLRDIIKMFDASSNRRYIKSLCETLRDIYVDGEDQYTVLLYSYVVDMYKVIGLAKGFT